MPGVILKAVVFAAVKKQQLKKTKTQYVIYAYVTHDSR